MMLRRAPKLLLLSSTAAVLIGVIAASPDRLRAQNPASSQSAASTGTTMEDCAACHEDVVKAFAKNPHEALEKSPHYQNLKNPCEGCHGPGEAHIAAGGDKTQIIGFKGTAKGTYNRQCLTCHNKTREIQGFTANEHAKNGLACSDCHRVHGSTQRWLLKSSENALCFSCHVGQRMQFSKPFHHRVIENAMTCVDCHEPHNGLNRRLERVTEFGKEPCFKCHSDKQGPFVFEHAPLVIRNCFACHEPHGSNNRKMLVRSTMYLMCLECHASSNNIPGDVPPSFHNVRSPRYQNCTTCHVKIHGSNADPFFFR
jgi:DmsE family decaheme c-type cytochrome